MPSSLSLCYSRTGFTVKCARHNVAGNLPLTFAQLMVGAILLDHGVKDIRAELGGGSSSSATATASAASASSSPKAVQQGVSTIAKQHGWGASEIAAWLAVIAKESGGSLTVKNASSGAYGIAQFIDGPSEYAQYGGNSETVIGQLTSMANYIEQRYGTPTAALAHENTNNWY